ncbi:MAG: lipoyl synthase [Deltaproteobacteria bacterium]|nr:lipoyl synthase [Deltaproteobacteria bacterium]MBW1962527.1 lipoyl synthase [Deltaproteobacteria bacterium]MBW1992974.1 lipoyl synthase [Deltaproteobacteria bacterium]MBW2150444.1 lipoyl synthase [Deltaproteobacteria bacterium]
MVHHNIEENTARKPYWLKRRLPTAAAYEGVRKLIYQKNLHTVCQEARCPNIWECFSRRTATFLILGSNCTRNCRFCAVSNGPPAAEDPAEPEAVAMAVKEMQLDYVVVTSVTRDDLSDGGAGYFAATIDAIRKRMPDTKIEVLIPDFKGSPDALQTVIDASPDVLNHNLETVPRLYPRVRPQAVYRRSMELLQRARKWRKGLQIKSGLMLGLGESRTEIHRTLQDLLSAGCDMLTLGQYLQPTANHLPVSRFIPPEEFDDWKQSALKMGFKQVASGPFVRSSYHAREFFQGTET